MIWIIGAVILGLLIGYISHKFQKAFLGMLVLSVPVIFILYVRVFVPLAKVSGLGSGDPISVMTALLSLLPQDIQSAVTIFPMAIFGGRFVTWLYAKFIVKPTAEESKSDRRKRILQQYGYEDGMPY